MPEKDKVINILHIAIGGNVWGMYIYFAKSLKTGISCLFVHDRLKN